VCDHPRLEHGRYPAQDGSGLLIVWSRCPDCLAYAYERRQWEDVERPEPHPVAP
jgi:hypothetical protein